MPHPAPPRSAYLVFDTQLLITRFDLDDYIWVGGRRGAGWEPMESGDQLVARARPQGLPCLRCGAGGLTQPPAPCSLPSPRPPPLPQAAINIYLVGCPGG